MDIATTWRRHRWWALAWLVAWLVGATLIVRVDIGARREAFLVEARTAHRVLGQAAAQLDAVLATLTLMWPSAPSRDGAPAGADAPGAALPTLYPPVVELVDRDTRSHWPANEREAMSAAESRSRAQPASQRHAQLAALDPAAGRYTIVRAGAGGVALALRVDAHRLAAAGEWPWPHDGPVRVMLEHDGHSIGLAAGEPTSTRPAGLTEGFEFAEVLDTPGQPLRLRAQRFTGPSQWPWRWIAGWAAISALATYAANRRHVAHVERRRAAEMARVSRVARLNALGELAAGVAHELNQPLTAVMAGTQTALRLLREMGDVRDAPVDTDPNPAPGTRERDTHDDRATALQALELAGAQARRAADVVARLRRLVQQPATASSGQPVDLHAQVRSMVDLATPQLRAHDVVAHVRGGVVVALADPVAVEQVLHNLITNAIESLASSGTPQARIDIETRLEGAHACCVVRDNGPGMDPTTMTRVFEPFFSTKAGSLGLGLAISQSLAQSMGGSLEARPASSGGACFVLTLPLADTAGVMPATART